MKNMIFTTIFCAFCLNFWFSCASSGDKDIESLSTELDITYTDANNSFSIKPPLDWSVKEKNDEWSFTPGVAEQESRNAKARLVVQYIKVDSMHSPKEFRDFIEYEIEQSDNVKDYKILEYGGTPSNSYCTIIVNYDSPVGKSTHYFHNILTGMGYFRISGSALSKHWQSVAPLLKASIETFSLKQ